MTISIRVLTAAWECLKKANLHHLLDGGILYTANKLIEININLSDVITDLFTGGVFVEFLTIITGKNYYDGSASTSPSGHLATSPSNSSASTSPSGHLATSPNPSTSPSTKIPWDEVDIAIASEVISDFFSNSIAVLKRLKLS